LLHVSPLKEALMKKLFALAIAALFVASPFVAAADKTIAEIVIGSKDHTTLLAAVKAAGLVETLSGDKELTVFAPTDAAFKKIDADTLKAVLADKEKLTAILTAHVVDGKVMAADVVKCDGKGVKTLQGTEFKVKVDGKKVYFGDALVTVTDIKAKNGVVHIIDAVLMPAAK